MANAKYLSVTAAAERLGVSAAYVRRLVASGRIRGYKLGPRAWAVEGAAVERLAFERAGDPVSGLIPASEVEPAKSAIES